MNSERTPTCSKHGRARRLVVASAIAIVVAAAFLPGAGFGSSARAAHAAQGRVPAGLAAAIHARFGPGAIRSGDSPIEQPELGFAVALSADGTTALVTAVGAGNQKGAAYIYHVASAGSWASTSTPAATLAGTAQSGLGESLGANVALSADGTTAFVGAPFRNGGSGGILVFHASDASSWASTATPTAILTVNNVSFLGSSGIAVSSDGTTLVVGDDGYNNFAGGAYIFQASGENAWASTSTPTATLSNAAASGSDGGTGYQVAISADGTTVLLSDDLSNGKAGGADLFHVAAEAAWMTSSAPTAILTNASGVAHDYLGAGLALSGDATTAFLGAPGANGYKGAVDVYHVANANLWLTTSTPTAILTNGAAGKNSYLGAPLEVSNDGATLVAAASGVNRLTGAAYVFHASGEGAWASSSTPTASLTDSHLGRGDQLGWSAAISSDGATILASAPPVNWWTGQVDLFHVADAGSWVTSSTPTAKVTNSALPKPRCIVPRLKKYPLGAAKFVLGESDCRLGKVKRVHAGKKYKRRIVSQSPAPGKNLPPGSKVSVKVGK